MELFFNSVWFVVSLLLVITWILGSYSPARRRQGDWGRQAVALGILLLVLLPVISLSDDLQAWIAPAEVEHGLRGADAASDISTRSQIAAIWIHDVLTTLVPITRLSAEFALACDSCKPHKGETHPLENRPPPATL